MNNRKQPVDSKKQLVEAIKTGNVQQIADHVYQQEIKKWTDGFYNMLTAVNEGSHHLKLNSDFGTFTESDLPELLAAMETIRQTGNYDLLTVKDLILIIEIHLFNEKEYGWTE